MKLAVLVTDYIAFKQTLGLRYRTDAYVLKAFCRALERDVHCCSMPIWIPLVWKGWSSLPLGQRFATAVCLGAVRKI